MADGGVRKAARAPRAPREKRPTKAQLALLARIQQWGPVVESRVPGEGRSLHLARGDGKIRRETLMRLVGWGFVRNNNDGLFAGETQSWSACI